MILRAFVFVESFLRNYPVNLTAFGPQKRMTARSDDSLNSEFHNCSCKN